MRPLTKETVEMARQGLLMSDWCGFSKRDTVNQLCDLALKGLTITPPEATRTSTTGWRLVPENPDYSMELAGLEKLRTPNKDKSLNGVVTRIYRAMIYAAPQERSAEVPRQVDVESGKVDQTVDGHRDHVPSRGDESTPAGAAPTLLPPSPQASASKEEPCK